MGPSLPRKSNMRSTWMSPTQCTWIRPADAPAIVIDEMLSGCGSCFRTWWEKAWTLLVKRVLHLNQFTCALTPKVTAFIPATPKRGDVMPLYSPRTPSFLWMNRWKNSCIWTRCSTSRSRTSSRRCPCRCPVETSGFAPSPCPKDIQPTLQLLLSQDWFRIRIGYIYVIWSIKCAAYLPYSLPQIQEPLSFLVIRLICCWLIC